MSPRKIGKEMRRMMEMTPLSALMQPAGAVVMILTRPGKPIPQIVTKSITTGNIKNIGAVVPLMQENKKINVWGR